MLKKISLIGVLLFSSLATATATASASPVPTNEIPEKEVVDGFEIEYLEDNDNFRKMQFTNLVTGEVEFLEIEFEGDVVTATATTDDSVVEMKRVDDTITEHNLTTNEINVTDLSDEMAVKVYEPSAPTLHPTNPGDYSALSPISGGQGTYYLANTMYRSKAIDRNDITIIVGILTLISTKKVAPSLLSMIAVQYYNQGAKNIWYTSKTYYWNNWQHYLGIHIAYYRFHNQTGFINSTWATVNH